MAVQGDTDVWRYDLIRRCTMQKGTLKPRLINAEITGVIFAAITVVVFLIDIPKAKPYLPIARFFVLALWALRVWNSSE
jgi:hypothetical protein